MIFCTFCNTWAVVWEFDIFRFFLKLHSLSEGRDCFTKAEPRFYVSAKCFWFSRAHIATVSNKILWGHPYEVYGPLETEITDPQSHSAPLWSKTGRGGACIANLYPPMKWGHYPLSPTLRSDFSKMALRSRLKISVSQIWMYTDEINRVGAPTKIRATMTSIWLEIWLVPFHLTRDLQNSIIQQESYQVWVQEV